MNNVNKLLKALNEDINLKRDEFAIKKHIDANGRRWLTNVLPSELLKRSVKQGIEALDTINQSNMFYDKFPEKIETPNYGDKWGIRANYIEINNRAIAEMHGNMTKNGILSCIKLLPAIPPSAKSWAALRDSSGLGSNIHSFLSFGSAAKIV